MDEASRAYPIRTLVAGQKPRSYTWKLPVPNLDQGREGACVGAGFTHELLSRPVPIAGLDMTFARERVYWPTQQRDPWEGGEYPGAQPVYGGTSVLDGAKTIVDLGYATGYRWTFSMDDLILAVGFGGPVVMGLDWFEGMFEPDEDGFIWPTGQWVGGHCILNNRVMIGRHARYKGRQFFELPNSWGPDWGPIGGYCRLDFEAMRYLLIERRGEGCVMVGRRHVKLAA